MKQTPLIRRLTVITMILASTLLCLCACGSTESEQGTISDVVIENSSDTGSADNNEFEKLDTPYGYRTKQVQSGLAYMKMDVPASFSVTTDSARHLKFKAPSNDPHMPDATIHLLYDFTSNSQSFADNLVDKDRANDASYFSDIFSWEIPALYYSIDGQACQPRGFDLPDETTGKFKFAKKADALVRNVAYSVDVYSTGGELGPNNCTQLTYFFRWHNIPCCLTTLILNDYLEDAETIMEYMISSCVYQPSRIDGTETYKVGSCTLSLPQGAIEGDPSNTIGIPVDTVKNASAGIVVGEYMVDTTKADPISLDTMNSTYALTIAKQLAQSKRNKYQMFATTDIVTDNKHQLCGKKTMHYQSMVTLDLAGDSKDVAGSFYGDPAIAFVDTLVISEGTKQYAIAIWYQDVQKQTAMRILSMAANSAKFKD